jgi:peptidoglycan hydrolase-like protein with peptidoglycan-binding domain
VPRELVVGNKGEDVRVLQQFLNFHLADVARLPFVKPGDLPLKADGDFGSRTDRAVRAFQQVNGLVSPRTGKPDGIVGPITRRYVLDVRVLSTFGLLTPSSSGFDPFGPLQLKPLSLFAAHDSFSNLLHPSMLSQPGGGPSKSPLLSFGGASPAPSPVPPPKLYTFNVQAGLQSFSKFDPIVPWAFSVSTTVPVPHNRFGVSIPVGVTLYENPITSQLLAGKAYVGLSVARPDWFSFGVQTALSQSLGPLDPHVQVSLTAALNIPTPFLWSLTGGKTSLVLGPSLTVLDIDPAKGVISGPKKPGSFTLLAGGKIVLMF